MSFVPAPQQANAAGNNNAPNTVNATAAAGAAEPETDKDILFKLRTFDVYWVDKEALMYKDGIDKVSSSSCRLVILFFFNRYFSQCCCNAKLKVAQLFFCDSVNLRTSVR